MKPLTGSSSTTRIFFTFGASAALIEMPSPWIMREALREARSKSRRECGLLRPLRDVCLESIKRLIITSSPMGRPIHADAEATKGRILDSARTLFADVGVDGASVRDVAAGAGVSLAMVHHYFGSKDDLYVACIDTVYAELASMRASLEHEMARVGEPEELIKRAVVAAYRFACAYQVAVRLL